jgi:hypothetical protein
LSPNAYGFCQLAPAKGNMSSNPPSVIVTVSSFEVMHPLHGLVFYIQQCMRRQTLSAIHAMLCERFEVGSEQALDDLVALAKELSQEGLLQQERG